MKWWLVIWHVDWIYYLLYENVAQNRRHKQKEHLRLDPSPLVIYIYIVCQILHRKWNFQVSPSSPHHFKVSSNFIQLGVLLHIFICWAYECLKHAPKTNLNICCILDLSNKSSNIKVVNRFTWPSTHSFAQSEPQKKNSIELNPNCNQDSSQRHQVFNTNQTFEIWWKIVWKINLDVTQSIFVFHGFILIATWFCTH